MTLAVHDFADVALFARGTLLEIVLIITGAVLAARLFASRHAVEVKLFEDGSGLVATTRDADRFYVLINELASQGELTVDAVAPADEDAHAAGAHLAKPSVPTRGTNRHGTEWITAGPSGLRTITSRRCARWPPIGTTNRPPWRSCS